MATTRTYTALTNVDGTPIIVDIHDGDTFTISLSASEESSVHPALRVRGLYCPELGQDGGLAAWLFTAQTLRKAKTITATLHGRSFARFVATVLVDNQNLADIVIAAGHGKATAD